MLKRKHAIWKSEFTIKLNSLTIEEMCLSKDSNTSFGLLVRRMRRDPMDYPDLYKVALEQTASYYASFDVPNTERLDLLFEESVKLWNISEEKGQFYDGYFNNLGAYKAHIRSLFKRIELRNPFRMIILVEEEFRE